PKGFASGKIGLVPEDPDDFEQYYELARQICARARERAHLSDDEIILLAVVSAQLALARHIEQQPQLDAAATLDFLLDILDRGAVVQAIAHKMHAVLSRTPPARDDAPSGAQMAD